MLHPKNSFECNVIWHMFEEHNIMSRTGRWRVKSWNKWKSVSRNFNSHKWKLSEHASLETNKNVYIFTCKNIYGIEKYLSFCKNRNYIFILEANTALTNWSMSKSICMLTKLGIPSNTQRNFLFIAIKVLTSAHSLNIRETSMRRRVLRYSTSCWIYIKM